MTAELGHFALILAFAVALVQSVAPMVGAQRRWSDWMAMAAPAAITQFLLIAVSFAALTRAFVTSDFSVALVARHSNSLKPMLYKVSGVWGNHEGSMLLWVMVLALFGALVAVFGRELAPGLKARMLSVQAMVGAAFLAFILFTSNPFERLVRPPVDGADLNPLLQDPGLAFHPPFLYLGYVGLSTAFSFAVAALIEGRVDAAWARWVRPWVLIAWITLTIGISLGSYWAYYELGWGGWWFWDPVENASFMPWLIAAALLHCVVVVEKRNALKNWTILLAILAFSLSLMGTFIVRSGLLTSVHSFASDPTRGFFILLILFVAIGGSLSLYAWRAPQMRSGGVFAPVSREGALILNNLFLTVACGVVFVGTLWPLILEMTTGEKISVGAPFFDKAFTPMMMLLILVLPVGAMLPWKRGDLRKVMPKLYIAIGLSLAMMAGVFALQEGAAPLAPVGLAFATWLILGSLTDVAERVRLGRIPVGQSLRRLGNLPRSDWGKTIAHAGFGLTVLGIAAVSAWEAEDIRLAKPGDVIEISGYEIVFESVEKVKGPNWTATRGVFTLKLGGDVVSVLSSEKRFYPVAQMPTTEAAIDSNLARDVYITLGDQQAGSGDWAVRSYVKPLAAWIWLGSLIMAAGGLFSVADRRYRVGAAARKKRAAPTGAVPAE